MHPEIPEPDPVRPLYLSLYNLSVQNQTNKIHRDALQSAPHISYLLFLPVLPILSDCNPLDQTARNISHILLLSFVFRTLPTRPAPEWHTVPSG